MAGPAFISAIIRTDEVGYSIRFEDVTSEKTLIKYMTDGVLLRGMPRRVRRWSAGVCGGGGRAVASPPPVFGRPVRHGVTRALAVTGMGMGIGMGVCPWGTQMRLECKSNSNSSANRI